MKMPSRPLIMAATLSLLWSASATSHAAANAAATVSNVNIQVVDLTPDDGQAGGIVSRGSYSRLFTIVPGFADDDQRYGDTRAATSGYDNIVTHVRAVHSGVPGEIHGEVATRGGDGGATLTNQGMDFWLQPHTSITITGKVSGYVQRDADLPGASAESAVSITFIVAQDWRYAKKEVTFYGQPASTSYLSYAEDFFLTYSNNADTAVSMAFATSEATTAWAGPLAPVPEPEGYAMLGAGLMLIGLMGRRRKPG